MAINFEKINAGGISLMANFGYYGDKPLDSRLVIPSLEGLTTLIENGAAYEGMIVFDKTTKKTYQVQTIDGVLSYREFGINEDELKALIAAETTAAMEFKGATASLPENPSKGDMWKAAANFTVDDEEVKIGDSIVYNGEQWFIIPSGDDIEDTWRPVEGVANDAGLKFEAGAKLDVAVANNGTITYSHEEIAAPELLAENEQTRTYITEVVTDGYGHITGYKTASENVTDTNTTYDFECAAEHSNVYFTVKEMDGETVLNTHTVCVDAYNKNEVDAKVEALNLEIYGNKAVQETSRIDTAISDASKAKEDAAEALRIAGEANTAASNAQTGAAASAAAAVVSAGEAADSAAEALASKNAASGSADAADASAQAAAGSASAASGSASNAASSANAASGSANAAAASAGAAAASESEANASASDAAGSASDAAASAESASASASAAAQSAEDALTAQRAATIAKGDAEEAQAKAEAAQKAAEEAKTAALDSNTSATAIANEAKATADKAVKDVSNVANNGLILTKSADNKISVDWDPSVVFVFNCGSSSTLID